MDINLQPKPEVNGETEKFEVSPERVASFFEPVALLHGVAVDIVIPINHNNVAKTYHPVTLWWRTTRI